MGSEIRKTLAPELKVLLVDDDRDALEELKDIVDLEGWSAETATNVDDALKLLAEDSDISVIVSDFHFAVNDADDANGVQFVSRAQAQFHDRDLAFIILSGDPNVLKSSLQSGAYKFLNKPLLVDDFVDAVRTAKTSDTTENTGSTRKMISI